MSDTKECPYCGNIIDIDAQTCEYCGKSLRKKKAKDELCCAKCKAPVSATDPVCPYCGAIFDYEAASKLKEEKVEEDIRHNMYGIPYNIVMLLTSLVLSFVITIFIIGGKETTTTGGNILLFSIVFVVAEILLYIYFLPSIIAIEKNNPNIFSIYIFNLLLGVTVIGWFVALIQAMQSNEKV